MKINNDIKNNCYDYEGFNLYEYGKTFRDSDIEKSELNVYSIKLLILNIVAYNPLKNTDMVILSSQDFKAEIKSDKLRAEFIRKVYDKITEKYLLVTNKNECNTIASLKNFTNELKGQYIDKDKKESERIEKAFDDEYRFIGSNREECERMNTSLFLTHCSESYNLDNAHFLDLCEKKDSELTKEQILWLKTLNNIHYNIRTEATKRHLL